MLRKAQEVHKKTKNDQKGPRIAQKKTNGKKRKSPKKNNHYE